MTIYKIEYEIFPLRAIYDAHLESMSDLTNKEVKFFCDPKWKIRKIKKLEGEELEIYMQNRFGERNPNEPTKDRAED